MKTKRNRTGRKLSQRRMLGKLRNRSSTGRRSRRVMGGRRPFGEEANFELGSKRSREYDEGVEMPAAKKHEEEPYSFYVFDNSEESRQIVGIDTPEMQHVTVNDYINSIENAYEDLRKNRLKSPEEKQKEEEFKEQMFAEVFPLLPQTGLEKGQFTFEATATQEDNLQKSELRLKKLRSKLLNLSKTKITSRTDKERSGGAPTFSGDLKTTLTMSKLRKFLDIAGKTVGSTEHWDLRISNFLNFMFNRSDVGLNQQSSGGFNIRLKGEMIDHYNFDLIRMTFKKLAPNATRELFTSMPWQLKVSGVQDQFTFAYTLKSVPPFCRSYQHDDLISETRNTSILQKKIGKFKGMSDPELRHLVYSVLAFIIFSNDGDEFENLCDEFRLVDGVDLPYETIASLTNISVNRLLELVKPPISVENPNKLPYFLFYTSFNTDYVNKQITQSDIRMINPKSMRRRDIDARTSENISPFVMPFKYILDNLYTQIFKNVRDEPATAFKFNITIPPLPDEGGLNKVHISSIPIETNYALRFEFGIKSPSSYDPTESDLDGKDGKGSIFDKNKKAHSFIPNSKTVNLFVSSSRTSLVPIQDICEINRYLFNVNSRIPIHRDNILGYLSDIVYYPNDVVKKLSTDYMTTMSGVPEIGVGATRRLYYIGGFDDDPSYPYAFSNLAPEEPPKPSYSRVHVWLNYTSPGTDIELYYVARGSKTGYDWHSADMDIANGILFSKRNLDAVNVLRNVIEKINNLIISNELPGLNKRSIQIYSSGHSLGGNLALSISYLTLNMHLINGMSYERLSGVNSTNTKAFIRPFIIPIVFDPFVATIPLFSAYSTIPYAHIHSCIDSTFQHQLPVARSVERDITKSGMEKTSEFPFDDPASSMFINYLRQKHSHIDFNVQMGKFRLFLYKNPHNFFENTNIHYPGASSPSRLFSNMTRAHDLRQMIGIKANYVWVNEPTNLFIKANGRDQSMQISAYIYPTPQGIRFKVANSAIEEKDNGATIDTFILTNARTNLAVESFLPRNKTGLLDECIGSLKTDFNRFFTNPN